MMHIKIIKLIAVRGINFFIGPGADVWGADASATDMPKAQLSKINVFIGRNGAGKSTVLDVVRALIEPSMFSFLKRDLLRENALYSFDIKFESKFSVNGRYIASKPAYLDLLLLSNNGGELLGYVKEPMGEDGFQPDVIAAMKELLGRLNISVGYWHGPKEIVIDEHSIKAMQRLAGR